MSVSLFAMPITPRRKQLHWMVGVPIPPRMALIPRPLRLPLPRLASESWAMVASPKSSISLPSERRMQPILLFDVMDTLVRDPFYQDVPAFFGLSMKELLEIKHPTAWIEFETGEINELQLEKKFFKDGRPFDFAGFKECIKKGYVYLDGMESLLQRLKQNGYGMHTFTNYPIWYWMIEEKLKLSTYLSWTFCSCILGKRKPAHDAYTAVLEHLGVEPSSCIFIDDRMRNVEAAINAGMVGVHFKNADDLEKSLYFLGVETSRAGNADDSKVSDSSLLAEEH